MLRKLLLFIGTFGTIGTLGTFCTLGTLDTLGTFGTISKKHKEKEWCNCHGTGYVSKEGSVATFGHDGYVCECDCGCSN